MKNKTPSYFDCELDALEYVQGLLPGSSLDLDQTMTQDELVFDRGNYQIRVAIPGYYEQAQVARFVVTLVSKCEEHDDDERELGSFEYAEDCARFCLVAQP